MTAAPPAFSQTDKTRFAAARARYDAGDFAAARDLFARLAADLPDMVEPRMFLSHAAFEMGDTDTCIAELRAALTLQPGNDRIRQVLIDRLVQCGRHDDAIAAYDAAIAQAPRSLPLRAGRAHLLQVTGDFRAADRALAALLKKHPNEPELYRFLVTGRVMKRNDPFLRQMLSLWKHPRLNDHGRMHLGFALATAMEQIGEPRRVFPYLDAANAAQARLAPMDWPARDAALDATLAAQDGADTTPVGPDMALRPVFIIGMPRSGTTLIDRIIGAHPQATPGGELGHAVRRARLRFGDGAAMVPLSDIGQAALADWAAEYQMLARRDTGAVTPVITDKAMGHERILGLIRRGLPGARLIVVHRDPRDIALSIYRNPFALGTHRYANALPDIARAIRDFRRTIAHWRTALPAGAVHEIHYDALVADPEPQARALLDAAGLDWDPACLSFHENRTTVQTLSVAQARQPLHGGRRQAWRQYEAEMQPFLKAWGDEPWD